MKLKSAARMMVIYARAAMSFGNAVIHKVPYRT